MYILYMAMMTSIYASYKHKNSTSTLLSPRADLQVNKVPHNCVHVLAIMRKLARFQFVMYQQVIYILYTCTLFHNTCTGLFKGFKMYMIC